MSPVSLEAAALGALVALVAGVLAIVIYHRSFVAPRLRAFMALVDGSLADPTRGLEALSASFGARTERRLEAIERLGRERDLRCGFVRYNSFANGGPDLSFSLALLTDEGHGVVVTSIYSREETRTFGKAVEAFSPVQGASEEERLAIARARGAVLETAGGR